MICEDSLSRTLDAVEEVSFESRSLPVEERTRVAHWIATRQGLPGSKSGSFAAFDGELRDGMIAFTGERFTHASARHILGEEACRALRSLDVSAPTVQAALERADAGLMKAVGRAELDPRYGHNPGVYCCAKCSVGVWRNLLSGGLDRQEERMRRGVGFLREQRTPSGRWRNFPFWYTVLALSEMDVPEAHDELRHAAPSLERVVRRPAPDDTYGRRRQEIASRALSVL